MAYCTETDLKARFGTTEIDELADKDHDGQPDAGVIDAAIADASGTVDGYLRAAGSYTLPISSPPELIKRVACDIARYNLWDDAASEEVRNRHQDAMRILRDISAGTVALDIADQNEGIQVAVKRTAADRRYTRETLDSY